MLIRVWRTILKSYLGTFQKCGMCVNVQRSPFVEMPMGSGIPTGPRGRTHRDRRPNVPTPRYHQYRVMDAGSYLHTQCASCNQLYSRQLKVTCFLMQIHTGPISKYVNTFQNWFLNLLLDLWIKTSRERSIKFCPTGSLFSVQFCIDIQPIFFQKQFFFVP